MPQKGGVHSPEDELVDDYKAIRRSAREKRRNAK
jgi:hypothetical protein